jgi:hypothetical protein
MGRALLGLSVALAAVAAAERAHAGAWIVSEDGQQIWTSAAGERDGLTYFETSAYWEIPLAPDVSVVATPWVEQAYDLPDGWRGEATVGVKRAIFSDDATVMALQAGAFWRSDPPEGCSEGGVELRWLGGRSLGQRGFLNLEAAGRALVGGCGGERLELTMGYRPSEDWLLMGQVFADFPHEGDQSVKFQVSIVRFTDAGRGIQLGLRARLDGGGAEPALVLGLWGRPGD